MFVRFQRHDNALFAVNQQYTSALNALETMEQAQIALHFAIVATGLHMHMLRDRTTSQRNSKYQKNLKRLLILKRQHSNSLDYLWSFLLYYASKRHIMFLLSNVALVRILLGVYSIRWQIEKVLIPAIYLYFKMFDIKARPKVTYIPNDLLT